MAMIRTRRLAYGYVQGVSERGTGDYIRTPEVGATFLDHVAYTVPAGVRAILRDGRFGTSDPAAIGDFPLQCFFYALVSGVKYYIDGAQGTRNIPNTAMLVCDVVLEAGDQLGFESGFTPIWYYISGAELTL